VSCAVSVVKCAVQLSVDSLKLAYSGVLDLFFVAEFLRFFAEFLDRCHDFCLCEKQFCVSALVII
jgi:hypothetical protein